jgi:thiol-disulfide isomerase/thioredoxin
MRPGIGILCIWLLAPAAPASGLRDDSVAADYGMAPMLLIASGIDADGNLLLSATEQRKKTLPREIEIGGKRSTVEMSVSYPVTFLNRQSVSVKDAAIFDREGNKISLDQARERLKEPTAVLLAILGEKVNPIFLNIVTKETLVFVFPWFPEFKQLPKGPATEPASSDPDRKGAAVAVGEKVPDLTLQTLDGKSVKLSELQKDEKRTKDGVIVLSFWCSTCGSCRRVEHSLDKLAKDYAGRAAVMALDVNAGETGERVTLFAKENGLTMPIVLDPSGSAADVFGTELTTTTVVIDRNGVLRYYGQFGNRDHAYAEEALKAVLAGQEVAVKTTKPDG